MVQLLWVVPEPFNLIYCGRIWVAERLLLLHCGANHTIQRCKVVVSPDQLAGVQTRLKKRRILRIKNSVLREKDLNKVDVLFSEAIKHQADVFHIHMLIILHDVRVTIRLSVQYKILERGEDDEL